MQLTVGSRAADGIGGSTSDTVTPHTSNHQLMRILPMQKKISSVLFATALALATVVSVYGATCTVTVEKADGTKIVSKAEGDTCTLDVNAGTCTCS